MKGDAGGTIECPLCGNTKTATSAYAGRNGTLSTSSTLRSAMRIHVLSNHPELGPRERSTILEVAVCGHHFLEPLLEEWTADGARPFRCRDCGAILGGEAHDRA